MQKLMTDTTSLKHSLFALYIKMLIHLPKIVVEEGFKFPESLKGKILLPG